MAGENNIFDLIVWTDKADYAPGEFATFTVEGVSEGGSIEFHVQHVTDPGADGTFGTLDDVLGDNSGAGHEPFYVTDGGEGDLDGLVNGSIETTWHVDPDDSLNETFLLTARELEAGVDGIFGTADDVYNGRVATTSFTDAQLAIWAWRNQPGPTLDSWDAGTTIQQANSIYAEDEVIPYRWTSISGGGSAPNLVEGQTYTIQLDYAFAGGTTSPQKFFHDYLTSYNATEPATVPFGPGSDLAAFQTGNLQTIGVPDDPGVAVGDPSGVFTLFNIDHTSVTFGSYTVQPVNANQEDRLLNITFIPDDGDATPGETLNVGVAWGAHLASQVDYGFENGAANFPGASPQMVVDLDPSTSGEVSNVNINPNAIVAQGQITVFKDAIPDDPQDFGFTITGPDGANITPTFTLDDDGDPNNGTSNQITFFGLTEGVYTITEDVVSGWSLTAITGTETGAEDTTPDDLFTGDTGTRTATITVANGEVWTVDFTNEFAGVPEYSITKEATAINGDTADTVINAAGDVVTYEIVVTNDGNVEITGASVADPLLQGANGTFSGPVETGGTGINGDGILDVGETWTYTGSYTVQQSDIDNNGGGDSDIDNTATVTSNELGAESSSASVPLEQDPSMTISKVLTSINGDTSDTVINAADDVVVYTVVVTNDGNETLDNVAVTDPLTGMSETITSLAPGASTSFTTSYTVTQADIDNNGGGDSDIDNTVTAVDDRAGTETATEAVDLEQDPSIAIEKVTGNGTTNDDGLLILAGSQIVWTYTVTNPGNVTIANVVISDDAGTSGNLSDDFNATFVNGDDNGNFKLDLDETWTFEANGTAQAGIYENIGTVTGDYSDGVDTQQVSATDPSSYTGLVPGIDVAIDVEKEVSVDGGATWFDADDPTGPFLYEGTDPQFKFVVKNTGTEDLSNVTLTDSDFNIDTVNGDGTVDIGPLTADDGAAGGTDEYELIYTDAVWEFGQHTNTATVSGEFTDDLGDTNIPTDTDDANYLGISAAGQITPTGTACDDYISGMAENFEDFYDTPQKPQNGDIQYNDNNKNPGIVNSANPGVFMYYTGLGDGGFIKDDGTGEFTVEIDQENQLVAGSTDNDFPLFNVNSDGIKLFQINDLNSNGEIDEHDSCEQVQLITDPKGQQVANAEVSMVNGDVTLTYLDAAPNTLYVVEVKYETDTVKGTVFDADGVFDPNDAPTINYTFETLFEGELSETDDQGGINLSYKFDPNPDAPVALTLDGSATVGGEVLTQDQLTPVVDAAINYWAEQGVDAEGLEYLLKTDVRIEDLGGSLLGEADGLSVTLDDDAAGYGWSDSLDEVDAGEIDLLSAVTHEFGHILGFEHDVMEETLGIGERALPLENNSNPFEDESTIESGVEGDLLFG